MPRLFFMLFAITLLCSCSSNEKLCGTPMYSNEYYNNVNVNPDYPCVINACGYRVCNSYDEIKDQHRNHYYNEKSCNR